jgi:hypothetical protein
MVLVWRGRHIASTKSGAIIGIAPIFFNRSVKKIFFKYVAIGSIEISSHRRPHCTICSLGLHQCCWSVIDLFSISTGWLLLFIYFHLHTGYQILKN